MAFPAEKISLQFLGGNPDSCRLDFGHHGGYNLLIIARRWLTADFLSNTVVFLKQPCADLFFLPLLQMAKLLVGSQQPATNQAMIFSANRNHHTFKHPFRWHYCNMLSMKIPSRMLSPSVAFRLTLCYAGTSAIMDRGYVFNEPDDQFAGI